MIRVSVIAACLFTIAIGGCALPPPKPPEPNPVVTASCRYPVLIPAPETKEHQTKGGITISLAPNMFTCVKAVQRTAQDVQPTMAEVMQNSLARGNAAQAYKLVEITSTPVLKPTPERITFRVKINNEMSRIFRGAGTIVAVNFGRRNVSIGQEDYAELTNITVTPRSEAQVVIRGPAFENVPDKTILGIFLYDVVTRIDEAGNVKEKQNYEWYYTLESQTKEESGEVVKTREWVRR